MEPTKAPARPSPTLIALLVCLAALALPLAACGGDDETTTTATSTATEGSGSGAVTTAKPEKPAGDRDGAASTTLDPEDQATTIPEVPVNEDPVAVRCTGQPKGIFDATAMVGEDVEVASDAASAEGCEIRVVVVDGKPLAVTEDFRPDRINVKVEDDKITAITGLG